MKSSFVYLVPTEKEAEKIAKENGYLHIPDYDVFPFDELEVSYSVVSNRIRALYCSLKNELNGVATLRSVLHYVMSPELFSSLIVEIKNGGKYDFEKIFSTYGYERVFNVRQGGQFAIRGDIVDFFGPMNPPTRIELFDNEVESIRTFDILNQRSVKNIDSVTILPCKEYIGKVEDSTLLGEIYRATFKDYNINFYSADTKSLLDEYYKYEQEIISV